MSGQAGQWSQVVENVRRLSKLTYVTVGVVFNEANVETARDTILYAHELGVADIRIISAAQYNRAIGALESLPASVLDAHPILKYRVTNHAEGRGVRGLRPSDNRRCPLVLDDMAVAGQWHFPCIIYLREQGDPIGRVDGDIRAERRRWAEQHDCYADAICRANCLDVCIDYNNKHRDLS